MLAEVDPPFGGRVLRYVRGNLQRGPAVTDLHDGLVTAGEMRPSQVDGIFGRGTERAVKRFQKRAGLTDDGIVGRITWRVLFNAPHQRT